MKKNHYPNSSKNKEARTIRLAESVAPFGPGAIVDILGESFMAPTGDLWPMPSALTVIDCPRLVQKLNFDGRRVEELRSAPIYDGSVGGNKSLEFARFPAWMFCEGCRRMHRWNSRTDTPSGGGRPECEKCNGRLVPMRFILLCTKKGHADDVPWDWWVHRPGEGGVCSHSELRFESTGSGTGLSSLRVQCICGATRTLGELNKSILARDGITCRGRQPWQRSWNGAQPCGEPVDAQQRGATNVRFGEVLGAIDIPPVESRADILVDAIRDHPYFDAFLAAPTQSPTSIFLADEIANALDVDVAVVLSLRAGVESEDYERTGVLHRILDEEFEAFDAAQHGAAPSQDFVTRVDVLGADGPIGEALTRTFSATILVDRLREVRASIGFQRYKLDTEMVRSVPASVDSKSWLPAVESYGEGIFIRFNPDVVDEWAGRADVLERYEKIGQNLNASKLRMRLHEPTPQFLMLHSFAHMLMGRLAHSSGYSAPALRERVYSALGDYGVLVYTTTGGTEGTLGGLVREGEGDRLPESVVNGLVSMTWCANDPVCAEASPQSIDGLNLAACHSCLMAPETSCESTNLLLDRSSIVGELGFFDSLVRLAQHASIAKTTTTI